MQPPAGEGSQRGRSSTSFGLCCANQTRPDGIIACLGCAPPCPAKRPWAAVLAATAHPRIQPVSSHPPPKPSSGSSPPPPSLPQSCCGRASLICSLRGREGLAGRTESRAALAGKRQVKPPSLPVLVGKSAQIQCYPGALGLGLCPAAGRAHAAWHSPPCCLPGRPAAVLRPCQLVSPRASNDSSLLCGAGQGGSAASLALPAGMRRGGGGLVPRHRGGTITGLLVTLGQLMASGLCPPLPSAWAGLELPGQRWLPCKPCVPKHSLGAGDECGSSGWRELDDSGGMGDGTIARCAGGKLRHSGCMGCAWGAGGSLCSALRRAVPGWSGHSTSREGGRDDGGEDNAKNTPDALLAATIACSIFSCCGISGRAASLVLLLPHPTLGATGYPTAPRGCFPVLWKP